MPTPDGRIGSRDLCTAAVIERTIADGGVSSLKISATLQSDNFSSGSAGWQINRVTGSCEFQDAVIRGTLSASDITTGTLDASLITVANLSADSITTGTLNGNNVTVINLNASAIATGTLSADFISGGTISGTDVTITNLNATNITSGSLNAARLGSGTTGGIIITLGTSGKIQSADGSTNVLIQGNGYARFKNVDVTGTINATSGTITGTLTMGGTGLIKTAQSGQRIQISSTNNDTIELYTGMALETSPAKIVAYDGDVTPVLRIRAPNNVSGLDLTSAGIFVTGSIKNASGTRQFPSYAFSSESYSGMYLHGTNEIAISIAQTRRFSVSSSAAFFGDPNPVSGVGIPTLRTNTTGSATTPVYTFSYNTNTGMWLNANNYIGFATDGSIAFQLGPSGDHYIYNLATAAGTGAIRWSTSTNSITYQASDERYKHAMVPFTRRGLTDLLRPIEYAEEEHGRRYLGFGAQTTARVDQRFGLYADGEAVNYDDRAILAALVVDLQDTRRRLAALEAAA